MKKQDDLFSGEISPKNRNFENLFCENSRYRILLNCGIRI